MKLPILIVLSLFLSGCAAPVSQINTLMSTYDKDTEYGVDKRNDGFGITVYYSRYQFISESDEVAKDCKSQLTAIAGEYSDKMDKEITPVNEQRISISMGRNDLTNITSCQADIIVKWGVSS
jgi:hypothetical protein